MLPLRLLQRFRLLLIQIRSSIAFYPAIIALGFLVVSILLLKLESSELGDSIKATWPLFDMQDAGTARAIAGTVAAGILSLTVFSFSMVMIVLNQAAANMSNRLLDLMINNRFQQFILGMYIGTIVYALFILSTISENKEQVPGITIFILILLTIVDIFLFIYFLHYITQSVKYDTNIKRLYKETLAALRNHFPEDASDRHPRNAKPEDEGVVIRASTSGYFQEFRKNPIISLCKSHDWQVEILILPGMFVLESMPVIRIFSRETVNEDDALFLLAHLDFYDKQDIASVPYWGFHQLMEIAIKALSPGINDPVTAVHSLNAMAKLLRYRLTHDITQEFKDDEGRVRIFYHERSSENIAQQCLFPIWDYGKNDRTVVAAMHKLTGALAPLCHIASDRKLFSAMHRKTGERMEMFEPTAQSEE